MGPSSRFFKFLFFGGLLVFGSSCAKYGFSPADLSDSDLKLDEDIVDIENSQLIEIGSAQMNFSVSNFSATQENLHQNKTVVSFQVETPSGDFINNLTASSISVKENSVEVPNFQLTSNPQAYRQTVDIAFLVDITCSMSPTITSAKTRIVDFIMKSRSAGYHTRICLSTFGDFTVTRCNRFFDNDPAKPETLKQVSELISEVSQLRAGCGAADPGGLDYDENPLQAIQDVESAPWAPGSQRFAILLTDAGFLYAPNNRGSLGAAAPIYANTLGSISRSQINIFAATPSLAGYNQSFGTLPGIVSASNGEYFPYMDLVSGAINFDNILGRILDRVKTTYALEYIVDEVPSLDPSLPLTQRRISLSLKTPSGSEVVRVLGVSSNLPEGRASYQKKWMLSPVKRIDEKSLVVKINGLILPSGYNLSTSGELIFSAPPAAGAHIEVNFDYKLLVDRLQMQPLLLPAHEDLNNIAIFLNGIKARGSDLRLEKNLESQILISPSIQSLSEEDPFKIREKAGLKLQVFRVVRTQQ